MRLILLTVFYFGLFLNNSNAVQIPKTQTIADQYFGKNRVKIFDHYVKTLSHFPIPSTRGFKRIQTDWKTELQHTKERFIKAQTQSDVYYALLSLQRSMHDAHSKLTVDPSLLPQQKEVLIPIFFRPQWINGAQEFVVSHSTSPQVTTGQWLKEYNGKKPMFWTTAVREWQRNTSPEDLLFQTADWFSLRNPSKMPTPNINEKVTLKLYDPIKKSETTIVLNWTHQPTSSPTTDDRCGDNSGFEEDYQEWNPIFKGLNYCIYQTKDRSLSIIRFFSFYYDFTPTELQSKLSSLSYQPTKIDAHSDDELANLDLEQLAKVIKSKSMTKVLIDVRNNGGGSLLPKVFALFSKNKFSLLKRKMFFPNEIKNDLFFQHEALEMSDQLMRPLILADLKQKTPLQESRLFPFFCKTDRCYLEEAIYEPQSINPALDLTVLSGPTCVSSCDQFVAILKDNKIAKVIGLPSMGGHSPFRANLPLKLNDGSHFKTTMTVGEGIRPNGEPLEGNPVLPDIRIELQDHYLQKVIEAIK